MNFRLLLILTRGELLRGGQRLLVLSTALVIGIGALVTISSFSARVELAIQNRSAELLGGQIRISAQRDLNPWLQQLPKHLKPDLNQLEIRTMAIAGEEMRLVELKTVTDRYPLLGELLIQGQGASNSPPPGSVYVEPALLEQLNIEVGELLSIGYAQLRIAGIIDKEPDRVAGVFSIGPRVMMNLQDLSATQLLQPGSRYQQSLLYAVEAAELERKVTKLKQLIPPWATLETGANGLETTRDLMKQASDFLHMIALAGLILASAAAAISIQSLVEQRTRSVATLKALGATRAQVMTCYMLLVVIVALLSGVIASGGGFLIQEFLPLLLKEFLPDELPPVSWVHFAQGIVASVALCTLFAALPFFTLASTPPVRVFQQLSPGPGKVFTLISLLLVLLVVGLLFQWITGNWQLVFWSCLSLSGLLLLFFAVQSLVFPLLTRLSPGNSMALRYALRGLIVSSSRNRFAISALALGILALLVPVLIQTDLIRHWHHKVPENAPNRFLIDIQPHQKEGVAKLLTEQGIKNVDLWPMVRARITHLKNIPAEHYEVKDQRAKRFLSRENNLSWLRNQPPEIKVLQGNWWPQDSDNKEISAEKDWAETLGLKLGDSLTFNVQGTSFEGIITSIRDVEWESMRPNFFLILSPAAIEGLPASWVTSFQASEHNGATVRKALIKQFPNVTVINLDQVVTRMQEIISRISQAVSYLSSFTLLAGLAVLMAVIIADRKSISQETALLRMIGATDSQVKAIFTWRFLLLGGLAAALGIAATLLVGELVTLRFLQINYRPNLLMLGGAMLGASLLVLLVGRSGTRSALKTPPLVVLRGLD